MSPTEEYPDECITPRAPRLIEKNAAQRYASVEYDRNPEVGDMQLAFAPWPSEPDDASVITRRHELGTFWTFPNLDTTLTYAVWQRDQCYYRFTCNRDTAIWGDWSEPLIFSFAPPAPDTLWLNDSTYVLGGDTIIIPHEGISSLFPNPYSLNIFPNPTTGEVRVECGELRVERIEVLDPQGRLLMEKEYSLFPKPYSLSLSALPKGAYLLRIHTGQGAITRCVVKN